MPPSQLCGEKFQMVPFDDNNRLLIIHLHNKLRNKLALGEDKRGGNGMAANMKALSYSKELEFVAQCYANACKDMGNHDVCRRTSKFDYVGQNMFGVEASHGYNLSDKKWIDEAIRYWYNEIVDTNRMLIDNFGESNKIIGHFVQIVWADTTHVGCGRSIYGNEQNTYMSIYCNYGVGGNILERPVYIRGQPCTQCGFLKCNNKYKGLCGDVEHLKDDKWTPPFNVKKNVRSRASRLIRSGLFYLSLFIIIK